MTASPSMRAGLPNSSSGSQRSLHQFFAREMKASTPLALRLYLVGQWERLVTLVLSA